MLVLGRKIGDSVTLISGREVIGKVTIQAVRGNVVRLGWEVPPHIAIVRTELLPAQKSEVKDE